MTLPLDGIIVLELSHTIAGPYCGAKSPGAPARAHRRAPHLGEHIDEVLKGLLGYSDEQVKALRDKGVC